MALFIGKIWIILLPIWAAIYTVSFGYWTWKNKNKLGGIAIFLVAVTVILLTTYSVFFRVH